jgi:hypothetical protein
MKIESQTKHLLIVILILAVLAAGTCYFIFIRYQDHGGEYTSKGTTLYYRDTIVKEVSGIRFLSFEYKEFRDDRGARSGYGTDGKYVYIGEVPFQVDLSTFEYVEYLYFKDKDNVYFVWNRLMTLKKADPHTFRYLGDRHARDKDYLYKFARLLEGEDPDVFEQSIK